MPEETVHPAWAPAGVTSLSRCNCSTGRRCSEVQSVFVCFGWGKGTRRHSSRMFSRKTNMSVCLLLFRPQSLRRDWANKKRRCDKVSCQANESDVILTGTDLLSSCFVLPAAAPGNESVCGQVCDFLFVWQQGSYFSSYFILDRTGSSNHDHKIKMYWCLIRQSAHRSLAFTVVLLGWIWFST